MANIVNLNTAQSDELTKLPGIGPAMAERITTARPFEKLEDLLNVSGVGPALLERLSPLVTTEAIESQDTEASIEAEDIIYLDAETSPEPEADDVPPETLDEVFEDEEIPAWDGSVPDEGEISEGDPDLGESTASDEVESSEKKGGNKEKAIIPIKKDETGKEKAKKAPKPITWGKALFMAAACSFAAFILAVLLSIGIIGSLNNGLRFASTDQVQGLSSQIETLFSELGILSDDLEGEDSSGQFGKPKRQSRRTRA